MDGQGNQHIHPGKCPAAHVEGAKETEGQRAVPDPVADPASGVGEQGAPTVAERAGQSERPHRLVEREDQEQGEPGHDRLVAQVGEERRQRDRPNVATGPSLRRAASGTPSLAVSAGLRVTSTPRALQGCSPGSMVP